MKKFENLILDCINPELTAATPQALMLKVKDIFESEMLYGDERDNGSMKFKLMRVSDWLQGLCNTVPIPFENYEILQWYASELKRPIKEWEEIKLVDNYWKQAALTLYQMLYQPTTANLSGWRES